MSLILKNACQLKVIRNGLQYWKPFDIKFHLDSKVAWRLQPDAEIFRTFTIGPTMWTEYATLALFPLRTYFHELGHLFQWTTRRFPKTPNFLLNYFVLAKKKWETEAEEWVNSIELDVNPFIRVEKDIRKLLKPT